MKRFIFEIYCLGGGKGYVKAESFALAASGVFKNAIFVRMVGVIND